ncbi:MAG TPA: copper chaperone PCu(A)C [Stellaceae bacterium]|nr:copper chaperone PCu(A)C [Stellaceae bacterium]
MRSISLALGATLLLLAAQAAPAAAQDAGVKIENPWARATPAGAQTAAAYATLLAPQGDRLVSVATPVAKQAQLHSMSMEGGVMKMRQVDGVDLPPGQAVSLKPGGYHIMLMGLAKPLEAGQSFPLTLTFAHAGARSVTVPIEKIGAMGPAGQSAGGQGGSMAMPGMAMPGMTAPGTPAPAQR